MRKTDIKKIATFCGAYYDRAIIWKQSMSKENAMETVSVLILGSGKFWSNEIEAEI